MNDERLNQYLEASKAKNEAQAKVSELETKQGEVQDKLDSNPSKTAEQQAQYHKDAQEYKDVSGQLDQSRTELKTETSKLDDFKDKNEDTSLEAKEVQKTAVPDQTKTHDGKQPEVNERLAPSEDFKDWNSQQQGNDPRMDQYSNKAQENSQDQSKQKEQDLSKEEDMER